MAKALLEDRKFLLQNYVVKDGDLCRHLSTCAGRTLISAARQLPAE